MNITRREFIKGSSAACLLSLSGIAAAAKAGNANSAPASAIDPHIEKSIKAGFGGGFSVRGHTQSGGLTYADIERSGTRYAVASADLLDWDVLGPL